MSQTVSEREVSPVLAAVLDRFDGAVDDLVSLNLTPLTDDDLLCAFRRVERAARRLAPLDHALINEASSRSLPAEFGCRNVAVLLAEVLRLDPARARARVRAAETLAARIMPSGAVCEPQFPLAAAALAAGHISLAHAEVIGRCVDKLPDALIDQYSEFVEKSLVDMSYEQPPKNVADHGDGLVKLLDQDGRLSDDAERERRRYVNLYRRPDGSAKLTGELTAEAAEFFETALDAILNPKNQTTDTDSTEAADDAAGAATDADTAAGAAGGVSGCDSPADRLSEHAGGSDPASDSATDVDTTTGDNTDQPVVEDTDIPDPRTGGQRRHDAFAQLCTAAFRSGQLPGLGGAATMVHLTADADAWVRGEGTATTGHGFSVSAKTVKKWAGVGDAKFVLTLFGRCRDITAYSCTQRIFTCQQRHVIAARDTTCSFPGCRVPAAGCEVHHVIPVSRGGKTTVANGTLLCWWHPRYFDHAGWTCHMINGIPTWTPPRWYDPDQRPRVNRRTRL